MKSVVLWAGGYPRALTAKESPEHLEQIAKLGATVLLAAVIAGTNWAVAAIAYTYPLAWPWRIFASVVATALGASIVLVIDRGALYLLDTRGTNAFTFLFAAARIVIILLISSFTSAVTIPVFMHTELEAHALHMREASDAQRANALAARFELPRREAKTVNDRVQLETLQSAAEQIPPEIRRELRVASACWRRYAVKAHQWEAYPNQDELQARLHAAAARCAARERAAHHDLAAYRLRMDRKISAAERQRSQDETSLSQASAEVTRRLREAGEIEKRAMVPTSVSVLWSLIISDAGARNKFIIFVSLMLALELMPLMTKLLSGRSPTGLRIGADQDIADLHHGSRVTIRRNETKLAEETSSYQTQAMLAALGDAATESFMREHFLAQVKSMAPLDGAIRVMRSAEQLQADADAIMARTPKLADLLASVWTQALRDSAEILNGNR